MSRNMMVVVAIILAAAVLLAISPRLFRTQQEAGDPPPHSLQGD